MITVLTLLKLKPSPNGEQHGERPFWREHGERYLDAWLASVERYVPKPHRVVVMTDTRHAVPMIGSAVADLDATVDAPGFWAKLEMFRHGEGKSLYCDLDNAINGPLDELCALTPDPLIMLDDRRVPGLPNGSLILFDAERCRHLWRSYAITPRYYERSHVARGDDFWMAYDQAYIAFHVYGITHEPWRRPPLFQDMLPDGYILNARSELPNDPDHGANARVIFGCGSTKPHTSTHPAFALR